jgi:hypothetical protein
MATTSAVLVITMVTIDARFNRSSRALGTVSGQVPSEDPSGGGRPKVSALG